MGPSLRTLVARSSWISLMKRPARRPTPRGVVVAVPVTESATTAKRQPPPFRRGAGDHEPPARSALLQPGRQQSCPDGGADMCGRAGQGFVGAERGRGDGAAAAARGGGPSNTTRLRQQYRRRVFCGLGC